MFRTKLIRFVLAFIVSVPASAAHSLPAPIDEWPEDSDSQQTDDETPPYIRVGNTVVTVRHPTMQSGVVQDNLGTVYLLTVLANGEKRMLRVSSFKNVKQLISYRGWPYVLDFRGNLYALDASWKNTILKKIPIALTRIFPQMHYALITGGVLAGSAALTNWQYGLAEEAYSVVSGFMIGMAVFYLADFAATMFIRTHRMLEKGGNFFSNRIATDVESVKLDARKSDFRVEFRAGSEKHVALHLSDIAPPYTGTSTCIYELTKLNME